MANEFELGDMPDTMSGPSEEELTDALVATGTGDHGELCLRTTVPGANEPNAPTVRESLSSASNTNAPGGTLATAEGTHRGEVGPMFPILVPDFLNWDPQAIAPTPPPDAKDRRGRTKRVPFFPQNLRTALAMMGLVTQRRNPVTIPADVFGAVLWGANRAAWPKNWLRVVLRRTTPQYPAELPRAERGRRTRESRAAANAARRVCPLDCPMHGGPNHLHATTTFYDAGLGRIKLLQCGKNPDGSARFDLTNKYTKDEAEKLQQKLGAEIADRQAYLRILREEGGAAGSGRPERAESGIA